MARQPQPIPQDLVDRLAATRATAAEGHREWLEGAPADALGRIAWRAGEFVDGEIDVDAALAAEIDRARAERFSWREITVALGGDADSPEDVRKVQGQHRWRRRT